MGGRRLFLPQRDLTPLSGGAAGTGECPESHKCGSRLALRGKNIQECLGNIPKDAGTHSSLVPTRSWAGTAQGGTEGWELCRQESHKASITSSFTFSLLPAGRTWAETLQELSSEPKPSFQPQQPSEICTPLSPSEGHSLSGTWEKINLKMKLFPQIL